MKKLFTLLFISATLTCAYAQAPDNGVELTRKNFKELKQDGGDYWLTFTNTGLKLETGSGDQIVDGSNRVSWYNNVVWLDGWKVSKNDKVRLSIPEGLFLTKIEMFGFVNGSKWDYLYSYGEDEWGDPEWADPIGPGIRNHDDDPEPFTTNPYIKENAVYPVDPCGCNEAGCEAQTLACHEAGYTFASLDFSSHPYEKEFSFVISGNNVICLGLRCWTNTAAGLQAIKENNPNVIDRNLYNLNGQVIDKNYRGITIKNGRKYIRH